MSPVLWPPEAMVPLLAVLGVGSEVLAAHSMLSGLFLALVPRLVGLKGTMSPSVLKTHILSLSGVT